MKLLKRIIINFFILFLFFEIFQFTTTPNITVINKTNTKIRSDTLQYIDNNEEPSDEDITDWRYSGYVIDTSDSSIERLAPNKRFIKEPVYLGIGFQYEGSSLDDTYGLRGVTFRDGPAFPNQKAYCGYKVEVYPNQKTIVTPTRKGWCIRPVYFDEIIDWKDDNDK